ncbi:MULTISPECIES: hypothetical protein [Pseudovibrio]|uniref:hypothetical protein n=1 Tax=Stappiaceae TaxID=2821832 RepID=UPI002364FE9C|nr:MULTISPECIES: hypothetical protein [Pseudovibrio]MDD7910106.1 hypothetical protein [Pseudovibrio exalbescens]MDX5592389.1 hypothetical protein [Pseudovibrio sp. SPO723]
MANLSCTINGQQADAIEEVWLTPQEGHSIIWTRFGITSFGSTANIAAGSYDVFVRLRDREPQNVTSITIPIGEQESAQADNIGAYFEPGSFSITYPAN